MQEHPGTSWATVNWNEVLGAASMALIVGLVRIGHLINKGRKWSWFDVVIEPAVSVVGGMMVWAICEYLGTPDIMQGVMTSLGSWGGPRTIAYLDQKYLRSIGSPERATRPAPLEEDDQ